MKNGIVYTEEMDNGIAEYYRRCDEERRAAYARLRAAEADPTTDSMTLIRLQRAAEAAGYTGD